ncbi:MAG: alpha/beta-type small acid-soluble spore protein [Clostridia bacterium]|nr:alpha/beta-type small acid-soluble spore protein [Clostridia bacterium]
MVVPEAKKALENLKYESAKDMGVNLKQGYNGDLTARENGSVGGRMVQRMIREYQEKQMSSMR